MTKQARFQQALAAAAIAVLTMACGSAVSGDSADEPGAIKETSETEIPGIHSENDLDPITAERWVDNVHLGRSLDENGKVPLEARADAFAPGEPIFVSMEVTDAPAGSAVRVSVFDTDTGQRVWTGEEAVIAGHSHLGFTLDPSEFAAGKYRAEVIIADETVAKRRFRVVEKTG